MARKNRGGRPKEFKEQVHPYVLRLPASLFDELGERASQLGMSVNDAVLVAVAQWLARRQSASDVHEAMGEWKRSGPK